MPARLGQLDLDRPEHPGRLAQHGQPGIGHGEEPLDRDIEVPAQPRVVAQPGHRAPVPAQHQRVQRVPGAAEHPGRGVCGRAERLGGLLLPAPGEPLLGLPAGRAAPVHQPGPYLGVGQPRRRAGEHPGRVAAQPDQQHADGAAGRGVGRDGPGHLIGARRQIEPGHGRERGVDPGLRSVRGHEHHRSARLRIARPQISRLQVARLRVARVQVARPAAHADRAVPDAEGLDPAREALRGHVDPARR